MRKKKVNGSDVIRRRLPIFTSNQRHKRCSAGKVRREELCAFCHREEAPPPAVYRCHACGKEGHWRSQRGRVPRTAFYYHNGQLEMATSSRGACPPGFQGDAALEQETR